MQHLVTPPFPAVWAKWYSLRPRDRLGWAGPPSYSRGIEEWTTTGVYHPLPEGRKGRGEKKEFCGDQFVCVSVSQGKLGQDE